ncbi:MAG: hypothetical protein B7O98_00885 [Zestosphaera tikiterensis]|uniref:Fe/B12 periplasmic-binding domain-containing protein n=1 Tax=Zestosphaera tikiterensis TaxID=1973259 RepID=A0A2R7Y8Z2_9CREN|nr:MAG: hypothetical protein B7O98_00885 [Zestosphaera tikiterensis]
MDRVSKVKPNTKFLVVAVLLVGVAIGYGINLINPATTLITTTKYVTTVVTSREVTTATSTVVGKYPLTVVDSLGRSITINRPPERVVSLAPSITEILFALGLDDRVVGVDDFSNYPPKVVELINEGKVKTVGGFWNPDIEKIASLKPDLVIASSGTPPHIRLKDKLSELGITVIYVKSTSAQDVNDIFSDIQLIAVVFDVLDRSSKLIAEVQNTLNSITQKLNEVNASKPKVLHLVGPPSWGIFSSGGNTFIGWVIKTAGGVNVAEQYVGWPQLSYEYIVTQDPDIIVITATGLDPKAVYEEIAGSPIKGTKAFKNGRIYLLTGEADDVLSRPGPRVNVALEILAKLIHPEIFGFIQRSDVINITQFETTPVSSISVLEGEVPS